MDKKQELYNQIQIMDKRRQRNIEKRAIKTIIFFAIVIFAIFYMLVDVNDAMTLLEGILIAVVGAVVYFLVNSFIFSYLVNASRDEQEVIDQLQRQYDELNK